MKQKLIELTEKRILREMYEDEKELKSMLSMETADVPEAQLDGLLVKIQQLLGKVATNQGKIILLQDITDDNV
jgi:hypothetical protein|tara:strand:- start:402 stop:620 length:219 start_codon:yes stop_codon:yes gene_type:complete